MSFEIVTKTITPIELALIKNDLSALNAEQRLSLYNKTCESLGLNPMTQPFGYLEFRGGKLSLYAKKDATDQLRKIHGVSVEITSKEIQGDIYIVCAKAKDSTGRADEDMGTVAIGGLKGEALANAYLKAITKAKRRVTLSICGLGLLDETEVDTIPDAKVVTETNANPPPNDPVNYAGRVSLPDAKTQPGPTSKQIKPTPEQLGGPDSLAEYVIGYGKKLLGKRLKEVNLNDLEKMLDWIDLKCTEDKREMKPIEREFYLKAEQYVSICKKFPNPNPLRFL